MNRECLEKDEFWKQYTCWYQLPSKVLRLEVVFLTVAGHQLFQKTIEKLRGESFTASIY
ncbi:MAG: hypothetical protein RMI45_01145 [Ignisphaera sp.]|nr:hypothetical protein [Ignisphaera sp.]MDW8084833.1 hypothetical protein [Ignisphaera sp.]